MTDVVVFSTEIEAVVICQENLSRVGGPAGAAGATIRSR